MSWSTHEHRAASPPSFEDAEDLELVVSVARQTLVGLARQEAHDVARPVAAFGAPGGAENLLGREEHLTGRQVSGLAQAYVAGPAAALRGGRLPPPGPNRGRRSARPAGGAGTRAPPRSGRSPGAGDRGPSPARGEVGVLPGEPAMASEVGSREQEDALGRLAVSARAARFLLVVLDRARRVGVDHEAHVGPVDAHAERDGGHDHVEPFADESPPEPAAAPPPAGSAW